MKKVIGIILILIIMLFALTGCTSESNAEEEERRFKKVYFEWSNISDVDDINIVYDKETKVQYIITDFYNGGAMTILLDADGKPLLYQGD